LFCDPNEPYREARQATVAQALARCAEANGRAATANARADVVTCSGCKAFEQGGDWGQRNCQELRRAGLCQRQVYVRVTMARLLVGLVRALAEAGASEAVMSEMVEQLQASLDGGHGGMLGSLAGVLLEGCTY
jgi:hypothetical protein